MYAFVFPGQGAQRVAMGQPWRDTPWWSLVEQLSDVTGHDVGRLLLKAGADELKMTANAQLATFTLSLVILDAVQAAAGSDGGPAAVAGHSLGEYSALVAAGVLTPSDGAALVAARGAAMGTAAADQPGTMAAVLGLDPEAVAAACAGVEGAWVANDNAPGQIVIAGTAEGVEKAAARARELGAKRVMPLVVGGAFQEAVVACVANVDAEVHAPGAEWRGLLSAQLTSPVRWRPSLTRLSQLGVTTFVELGPGTELSGMVKRTVAGATRANVATPDNLAALAGLG
jgi:[acyl-carrier-protein] S-malonyltransferase